MTDKRFLDALEQIKRMRLGATETAVLQMVLIVQNAVRSDWPVIDGRKFEDWTLDDICRALKVKVPA